MNIWYTQQSDRCAELFYAIGRAYYDIHGVYPKTATELPRFVRDMGYPCESITSWVSGRPGVQKLRLLGLEIDDQHATALFLRFGV